MNKLIALAVLTAFQLTASGRSIIIAPSPNITRNAGQTIPLTFTASGFASGSIAQIWLINAKTWTGDVVEIDVRVNNGVNNHPVLIPWSWGATGNWVVKIVAGSNYAWDSRVVTIRSAVIWPYAGTVFPQNGSASVSWVVGDWYLGEIMNVFLHDEDTGETYYIDYTFPEHGRFDFFLPFGATGNHFRILLDGLFILEMPTFPDDPESGQSYIELVESTQSALVAIH